MRRTELLGLRVDQVGSLLRPASLIESFLSCAKGEITRSALDALVEQAVRDVVARQQAIGFPVVTDGEYGRINWHVSFSQIEGWALDEASWRSFLANPAMRHEHERANTLGADAVQSYKTPATARLRLLSNFPLQRIPPPCRARHGAGQGDADGAGPRLPDVRPAGLEAGL